MTTQPPPDRPANATGNTATNPAVERRKTLMTLPLFRKAGESLGAQIWHVDEDFNPDARPKPATTVDDDPEET